MEENPLRIQDIKKCCWLGEIFNKPIHVCQGQRTNINGKISTSPIASNKFTADGKTEQNSRNLAYFSLN